MPRPTLVACVLVLCSAACSSTTGSNGERSADPASLHDAKAFCAKAGACGHPTEDCDAVMGAVRVTQACLDALDAASCEDLSSETSAAAARCFPPCQGDGATCNADGTVTKCSDGKTITVDCAASCSARDKAYTGTCGPSYGGQQAPDGQPVCWCR